MTLKMISLKTALILCIKNCDFAKTALNSCTYKHVLLINCSVISCNKVLFIKDIY